MVHNNPFFCKSQIGHCSFPFRGFKVLEVCFHLQNAGKAVDRDKKKWDFFYFEMQSVLPWLLAPEWNYSELTTTTVFMT